MRQVALFSHPACAGHDPGAGHPESPARLQAVLGALDHADFDLLRRPVAPAASRAQLCLAHPAAYVDAILSLDPPPGDLIALDADTLVGPGSLAAALHAVGAAIAAVDAVMEGEVQAAFAAVRPPGHHAEAREAMGFCLFNGVAIAAHHARQRWSIRRVAVVDFDVHHGNGTQHMFQSDPDLFYASSHQMPCYPGTGAAHETGVAHNVVNLPLSPGDGSAAFRRVWTDRGLPALRAFAPELLIVSAGFDAHRADPLAELQLETADFDWITGELLAASGGRLVSVLEGGYDLAALADCAATHVRRLIAG
jgi:acetoin utilization deacetylase AcuC-like enzyme